MVFSEDVHTGQAVHPALLDLRGPLPAGDSSLEVNGAAVVTTATLRPGICEVLGRRYLDNGNGSDRKEPMSPTRQSRRGVWARVHR